jgi:hypothetical protein
MKNTLTLGTLLLGCCLVAVGQTSSSSSSTSSDQSSQPGYSQGAGQTSGSSGQSGAGMSSHEGAAGMSSNQGSQAGKQSSIRGCLTKAADGSFMLADFSGNTFQLSGDTAQLNKHVGHEVRIDGVQSSGNQPPGAMSSSATGQGQQQFSVSKVHHVANTCRATGGSSSMGGSTSGPGSSTGSSGAGSNTGTGQR